MKKGGYKIIDLSKGTFDGTQKPVVIPGVHEAIESTNKRTVVSGLTVKGVEYNDFDALFVDGGASLSAKVTAGSKTIDIAVTSADAVIVTLL
mgnify:CR=1 FL=1